MFRGKPAPSLRRIQLAALHYEGKLRRVGGEDEKIDGEVRAARAHLRHYDLRNLYIPPPEARLIYCVREYLNAQIAAELRC